MMFSLISIGLILISATLGLSKRHWLALLFGLASLIPFILIMPPVKAVFIWLGLVSFIFLLAVVFFGLVRTGPGNT